MKIGNQCDFATERYPRQIAFQYNKKALRMQYEACNSRTTCETIYYKPQQQHDQIKEQYLYYYFNLGGK